MFHGKPRCDALLQSGTGVEALRGSRESASAIDGGHPGATVGPRPNGWVTRGPAVSMIWWPCSTAIATSALLRTGRPPVP